MAPEDTVLIGSKPTMNYVLAAVTLFNAESDMIYIKARGRAINRAVDVAEIIRNRFIHGATVEKIDIGTEKINTDTGGRINVSTIEIMVKKPEGYVPDESRMRGGGFSKQPPESSPTPPNRPTEEPAADEKPSEEPVVEEKPSEEPVMDEKPSEEPVAEEKPSEEPVTDEKVPAEGASTDDTSSETPPREDAPSEEPVSEEKPTSETTETQDESTTDENVPEG